MTDWRHDNYFGPNEFTNMKIKPVDNVYFGAHLPKKQKDMEQKDTKAYTKWAETAAESRNGRMVDKDRIDKGLWALSDWLKYNTESAWMNEHRLLSDHDYGYYQEVIDSSKRLPSWNTMMAGPMSS